MTSPILDLNGDLGEGFGIWRLGDDEALLDVLTSANIACGFHAGDPATMHRVTSAAVARGVAIGAQVSYRDLAGFGRRRIDVPADELADDVLYQIGALEAFAHAAGDRVRYLKPHGALYNTAVTDDGQAGAVVDAVRRYDPGLPILCLPGSRLAELATEAGLTPVAEAFADRAYTPEGHLVSRRERAAVLHDPETVLQRGLSMITEGRVRAIDGSIVAIFARSLCVHGDTPGAVRIAQRLREGLIEAGVELAPFTGAHT